MCLNEQKIKTSTQDKRVKKHIVTNNMCQTVTRITLPDGSKPLGHL